MKIFIMEREHYNDYALMLWTLKTDDMPSLSIKSRYAYLAPDSPAVLSKPADNKPSQGWFYNGADAEEIYYASQFSTDRGDAPGYLENDYESIREQYPEHNLKPYSELTHEAKVAHYKSWHEYQTGMNALGDLIRQGK